MTDADTALAGRWDAIVIGGGIGGLTAAAYLARAKLRVLLIEARDCLGGQAESAIIGERLVAPLMAHVVYAIDPMVVRDLSLHKRGLAFAERTMPLVSLRTGGRHLLLPHELFAARSAIHSELTSDANAYLYYRRELFTLARRMRPLWAPATPVHEPLELSDADEVRLELMARSSANAYLDQFFEDDSLKSLLALDACMDSMAPHENGSALALLWRAAQESCGMQAAVSQIVGTPGRLSDALAHAAREYGAVLRTNARATEILVEGRRAFGVRLIGGDTLIADSVLSELGMMATLRDLVPPDALPLDMASRLNFQPSSVAAAKLILVLNGLPPFAGLHPLGLRGRLLVAHRVETAAEAKGAALLGRLPPDLTLEITVPTVADRSLADRGQHVVSLRIPFMPGSPPGGWSSLREELKKRLLSTLETYAPGLGERVTATVLLTPDEIAARYGERDAAVTIARLLAPFAERIRSPVSGLYFCGATAEPIDAISGRAGRLAAQLALDERHPVSGER